MTQVRRSLLETALPLEAINLAGATEKGNPKSGLPATSHLWWSRKPVSVARAIVAASLLPDPGDAGSLSGDRAELLGLVGRAAAGDEEATAEISRLIATAWPEQRPVVLDPFAGGGSVPYEVLRLNVDALASDLNPVAVTITRAITEIPRRFPTRRAVLATDELFGGLAAALSEAATRVRDRARSRIGQHFPAVTLPDGRASTPVSWLWARTATCPNPVCGRSTALLTSWDLLKRPSNRWHLRPGRPGEGRDFVVEAGPAPASRPSLKSGRGQEYRCQWCDATVGADRLKSEGAAGRLGFRLVAIQAFADPTKDRGRAFVTPTESDDAAADVHPEGMRQLGVAIPAGCGNATLYGIETIDDIMGPRQKLALATFLDEIRAIESDIVAAAQRAGFPDDNRPLRDGGVGPIAYGQAIRTLLVVCLSRWVNRATTMTIHNRANGSVEQSFIQPAYSFYGEYAEANPFSGSTGSWDKAVEGVVAAVGAAPIGEATIAVERRSASEVQPTTPVVVITDPPYYDVFDYAALSTLFYAWMRAGLADIYPDEFSTIAPPSAEQLLSTETARSGGARRAEFEANFRSVIEHLREVQDQRFPLVLWYAYRQSEGPKGAAVSTGWEAMLQGLLDGGFSVTATWPVRTERPEGVKSRSNSLASSVVLACRIRQPESGTIDRAELLRLLRAELPLALRDLQLAAIAPVDLAQAAIGPGMAVFSRYDRVVEADGSVMRVRAALELINDVLAETLDEQDGSLDADTRWALKWFEQHGMDEGPFDRANTLATALGIAVDGLVHGGIVTARAGRVALVDRAAMPDDWDPTTDDRVSAWEATQHVVRALEEHGEAAAARLLGQLGPLADSVQALAYRLYVMCEQKGWAQEALPYNALAAVWGSLRAAAGTEARTIAAQRSLLGPENENHDGALQP